MQLTQLLTVVAITVIGVSATPNPPKPPPPPVIKITINKQTNQCSTGDAYCCDIVNTDSVSKNSQVCTKSDTQCNGYTICCNNNSGNQACAIADKIIVT